MDIDTDSVNIKIMKIAETKIEEHQRKCLMDNMNSREKILKNRLKINMENKD